MPNENVIMFIEAALTGQNEGRMVFALRNLDCAKKALEEERAILHEEQLFFLYTRASIFESAGRDDLAIMAYSQCRGLCDKLSFNHPDRALPFMGMGSVFYYSNEYVLALRAFLKVTFWVAKKTFRAKSVERCSVGWTSVIQRLPITI